MLCVFDAVVVLSSDVPDPLGRYYRVSELAGLRGFSDKTIIRLLAFEPGVIRLESPTRKRKYTALWIPQSPALRVHQRLGKEPFN